MALAETQLFEDAVPLFRSCPSLNEIRLSEEIKDLIIEVKDGARLHAHRIILAARIPSLRATIRGLDTEGNSVLRWPTVPLSIASAFISYIYTGQAELTQANVKGMVALASMMSLSDLKNWGGSFLASSVNLENLAGTWDFAKSLSIRPLMEACLHLMKTKFSSFLCSDLFVHLPAAEMLTLLQDDNLVVDSEEAVFAAIACWVGPGKENINERLKLHAPTMLKEVRWLQTTSRFRRHLMQNHQMFQNSCGCSRLLGLVEQWIAAADGDKPPCPFNRQQRSTHAKFVVFGRDKSRDRWSVLSFDSNMQKEERIADMRRREYASYSVIDGRVFVVGGSTAQQECSTCVEEFSWRERRWLRRAPLSVGRRRHAATAVEAGVEKTLICVFGGWDGSSYTSSCEVYDVRQDRWYKLPDLREKNGGLAAAYLPGDSRVFVFGGYNGSSRVASVEYCQLGADWQARTRTASSTDFWQPAAPMRTARSYLAATAFRGRILIAGGWDGHNELNVVELFYPPDANKPRGQWTEVAGMKQARHDFTLLTCADAVFALGHDTGQKNTVETLTVQNASADPCNDLSSWYWSSKDPVETLGWIVGAATIRM